MAKYLTTLIFICFVSVTLSTDEINKRATITNNNIGSDPGVIKINNNDANGASSITNNNFGTSGIFVNTNGPGLSTTLIAQKPLSQAIVNNNAGGVITNVLSSSSPEYVDSVKINSPFPSPQMYLNKQGRIFYIIVQNNQEYAAFISASEYLTLLNTSKNPTGSSVISNNNGGTITTFSSPNGAVLVSNPVPQIVGTTIVNNNGGSSSGIIINNNDASGSFSITNNNVGGSGFSITNNNI